MDAARLLRDELLGGTRVIVTEPRGALGEACAAACAGRGAEVGGLALRAGPDEQDEELAALAAPARPAGAAGLVMLVFDGAAQFAAAPAEEGLRRCLDGAWDATRAVMAAGVIAAGGRGRTVLIGPAPGAGPGAGAARRGLEAMARTLSIEWSPHGILTTAVLPGDGTAPEEVGALVALLGSPAGDYFSGCRLELGARTVSRPG